MLADCQRGLELLKPHALVADYSSSVLAIDPQKMMAAVRGTIGRGGALEMPTALLVAPDMLTFWRTYALAMAQHGIVRGVFIDSEKAAAWAREKAPIYRARLEAARRSRIEEAE